MNMSDVGPVDFAKPADPLVGVRRPGRLSNQFEGFPQAVLGRDGVLKIRLDHLNPVPAQQGGLQGRNTVFSAKLAVAIMKQQYFQWSLIRVGSPKQSRDRMMPLFSCAPSGLGVVSFRTQGSASLHPGLRSCAASRLNRL